MLKIRTGHWSALCFMWLAVILTACNLVTDNAQNQAVISGVPTIQIAAPPANAAFLENVAVNIQALIGNAGSDIDRIEILVDGTIIETLKTPNSAGAPSFSIAQTWQPTGAGQHTISVTAFRADGSSSEPAEVTINVVGAQASPTETTELNSQSNTGSSTVQPTANTNGTNSQSSGQSTNPPAPTNLPAPTDPPPPPTPSVPYVTINQGVNVRSGPDVAFAPPIGSLAAGATADLLAKSPNGAWFKIKYYNGSGWVASQFTTPSIDVANLTVDAGPPIPTPVPPTSTPIPATPVPVSNVDLVAGTIRLDPASPNCNQTFNVSVDVANFGQTANTTGGTITIIDVRAADGSTQQQTVGAFGIIQPGQTVNSGPIPLTVSTFHSEGHKIIARIDTGGVVPETDENNNQSELAYTLNKAGCP
ncbi:MAG: SH3 domain-containing protein [Anaerolineae bacterium]